MPRSDGVSEGRKGLAQSAKQHDVRRTRRQAGAGAGGRIVRIAGVLLSLAIFVVAVPAIAARPPEPQHDIPFNGAKFKTQFPHKGHERVECITCHHIVDDKETYLKCATAGCHDDVSGKGDMSLFAVVHTREGLMHQTCIECHVKISIEAPELKRDIVSCNKSKCHGGSRDVTPARAGAGAR
jgi:hypothetical protein